MGDADIRIKKSICTFCAGNCGVLVHVRGQEIVKIEGNKEHALSRGFICERTRYANAWLHHPDQLKYPLKRAGQRGQNRSAGNRPWMKSPAN